MRRYICASLQRFCEKIHSLFLCAQSDIYYQITWYDALMNAVMIIGANNNEYQKQ